MVQNDAAALREPSVEMGSGPESEGVSLENVSCTHSQSTEQGVEGITMEDDSSDSDDGSAEVKEMRAEIQRLLRTYGKEGDVWYLIPMQFLDRFLNLSVVSFEELRDQLGPVDYTSIVDSNNRLYAEDVEPVGTYNVPPQVFDKFNGWFGALGKPVARNLIRNPQTGSIEVERYPPTFYLHQLSSKKSHHGYHHSYGHPKIPAVTLSRTKTLRDLLDLIREKNRDKRAVRLWFVDNKGQTELPLNITPASFVFDVEYKKLVTPDILSSTLGDAAIVQEVYHVVVEQFDKSLKSFPLDVYVANMSKEKSSFNEILSMGGTTGLQNLGNTCYMNSALQCLLHVPEINSYFLFNLYKEELNNDNPLGYKGAVANSFGNLLKQLFDTSSSSRPLSIAPRDFKSTIGRYSSMFYGYLQQDSQEFLSWLLDALHEDLNRIHNKPYNDKPELKDEEINDPLAIVRLANTCWELHKLRNDSIIVDLFTGMYKSTLVCPDCSKTSITFDPFNDLTLPLPVQKKWYHTFKIVDLSEGEKFVNKILTFEVELDNSSNYQVLVSYLSKALNVPRDYLFLYELFRHSFYTDYQADNIKNKFLPIGDLIKKEDEVVVYIIPHNPETDVIVPVLNFVPDEDWSYRRDINFGFPLFVVLNKHIDITSFGTIRQKLEKAIRVLTNVDFEDEYRSVQVIPKPRYNKADFPSLVDSSNSLDDQEMDSDIPKDNDYDSDVSLANPYISGNFGFEVKRYAEDVEYKPRFRPVGYSRFASMTGEVENSDTLTLSYVPLQQINDITDAVNLIDLLPKKKKEYYYYAEIDQTMEGVSEQEEKNLPDSDDNKASSSSDLTEDGFILVGKGSQPDEKLPVLLDDDQSDQPQSPSSNQPPLDSDCLSVSNVNSPQKDVELPEEVTDKHPQLIVNKTTLICYWKPFFYVKLFGDTEKQAWAAPIRIPNLTITKHKKETKSISLYECLEQFSKPEVLGEHDLWYCPNCKDHKQATKTIEIWSTGDILTIHLKRFHSARAFSDKIDVIVDFPLEGLDMSKFISKPQNMDESNELYDLIAVDNHYGGLGGGHYTACVKNFRDNKWHYFNDSHVSEMKDPLEVVNSRAYLLFYKRRVPDNNLGGTDLQSKLNSGYETLKTQFDAKQHKLHSIGQQIDQYSAEVNGAESDSEDRSAHIGVGTKCGMQANLEDETENIYEDDDIYESNRKEDLKKTRANSINTINNDNQVNVRKMRLISKEGKKLVPIIGGAEDPNKSLSE